jgi:thiamine biosynthesis lipoprotein
MPLPSYQAAPRRRGTPPRRFGGAFGLALAGLIALGPTPAGDEPEPIRRARYVMGTRLEIRLYSSPDSRQNGIEAMEAAFARVRELDDLLTTWRAEGKLARLNRALEEPQAARTGVPVPQPLADALDRALRWSRRTDGLFDPTLGSLTAAWDLRGKGRIPEPAELAAARARSGHDRVSVRQDHAGRSRVVTEVPGLRFDLGGIGKGLALDAAAEVLRARQHRAALLDFAGQIMAVGPPPGREGWLVRIAHPADRRCPGLSLILDRGSLATSSNAERARTRNGETLGHVIDPRSGRPTKTRASASVLADSATAADALASALMVGGADAGSTVERYGGEWLLLDPGDNDSPGLRCTSSAGLAPRLRGPASSSFDCPPPPGRASHAGRARGTTRRPGANHASLPTNSHVEPPPRDATRAGQLGSIVDRKPTTSR